jgi:aminoglycoside phosphotransferase (APT) family kinase protein
LVIRWLSAFPLRDLCDLLLNFRKCLASCGRGMLDYNTKFDRRESTTILDVEEIRGLVSSLLNPSEIQSVSLLAGGFINSSYRLLLRDNTSLVLRISARSGDCKKELRVLKQVRDVVPVPTVIAEGFSGPQPFALIEFIEGALFSDTLASLDAADLTNIATEAGGTLQAIHSFDLGKAGVFDENFVFNPVFENFGAGLYNYICSNLNAGRVRERLGEPLAGRALERVRAKRDVYWSIPNSTRLIHCDYNLKNILIRKVGSVWKVAGVLDWEFAMAGSPLVDIGNFLRFEDELPPGFGESFIRGYLSNSIGLPANWREVARLLDLAAMINFLEREREAPKTFRTAISVIESTIESVSG